MITRRVTFSVAVAAGILLLAAALKGLEVAETIGPEMAKRVMQFIFGLMLAVYGNYMPKGYAASCTTDCKINRTQSVLRVAGWAMTLAGLVHAGLWAFAPIPLANSAASAVVAIAVVITIGYGAWTLFRTGSRNRKDASVA